MNTKKDEVTGQKQIIEKSMFNHRCLYITTTLPYINSEPHVGHAFEFVLADFFKRYYNEINKITDNFDSFKILNEHEKRNCFFNTGIDEHGQKVFQKSQQFNLEPQEYCDIMSENWKDFCLDFNISYNNFYRTSSESHKKLAQEYLFFIRSFIYQKEYSGKYCVGCESFKTEKEITENHCNVHPNIDLQDIEETNLFFPLSKFRDLPIEEILVDKTLLPELKSIVENCGDLSISRENVSWGIPIPFSSQTMYVWWEALLNYIFAIGYNPALLNFLDFSNLWKNSLIICGKDNLKFQAFILPAILKAGGINPPYKVLVHGMILDKDGIKMSKSLGNVIEPVKQIKQYNLNAVRYYFLAGLNTFQDSKYSEEDLIFKYNNDICNNLGNLISRVSSIIERDAELGMCIKVDILNEKSEYNNSIFLIEARKKIDEAHSEIKNNFNTKNCFNILNSLLNDANKYYTEQRPFDLESENKVQIIQEMVYLFILISPFYEAVTPGFCEMLTKIRQGKLIPYPKIETPKR